MRLFRATFICTSVLLGLGATGCYIDVNDDDWGHGHGSEAEELCGEYCFELVSCGTMDSDAFGECTDRCLGAYQTAPERTEEACECVIDAHCESDELEDCQPGPVDEDDLTDDGLFPGSGSGGSSGQDDDTASGGSASGGSASDGAAGSPAGFCIGHDDCEPSEDCESGSCLPRCVASCQCETGEACVSGHCQSPEDPPSDCETSCDCMVGETCNDGVCE